MSRTLCAIAITAVLSTQAFGQSGPSTCRINVVTTTIPELQAAMSNGRANALGLVDAYLARIQAYDRSGPKLNSIIRLNPHARAEAAALDAERKAGHVRGPLHGIPVLLKDNYDTRDMPTSGGSVALATFVPDDDAFIVQKLRAAGAVILGKTNMHELASGTTTRTHSVVRLSTRTTLNATPEGRGRKCCGERSQLCCGVLWD